MGGFRHYLLTKSSDERLAQIFQVSSQGADPSILVNDDGNVQGSPSAGEEERKDAETRLQCTMAVAEVAKQYNADLRAMKKKYSKATSPEADTAVDRDEHLKLLTILQDIADQSAGGGKGARTSAIEPKSQ